MNGTACNAVNTDLLLPNTVSQKDKKPHTAGLDTAIPHVKNSITELSPSLRHESDDLHFSLSYCDLLIIY